MAGGDSVFSDVAAEESFCRHVHTLGCGGGEYWPSSNVNRSDMAIFIAKAIAFPRGSAGVPLTYGPDPVTGLS
jgi:hypothetical protein